MNDLPPIGPILLATGAVTLIAVAMHGLRGVRANTRLDQQFEDFVRDPDAARPDDQDPRDLPLITDADVPDHLTDPAKRLEHAITRMRDFAERTPSQAAHDLVARKVKEAEARLADLGHTGTLGTLRGARRGLTEYRA